MTGHLARLAARATAPAGGGLRPRLPSLFEQPAGQRPGDPAGLRPDGADGAPTAGTAAVGAPRAGLARPELARPELARPELARPDPTGAGLLGARPPRAPGPDSGAQDAGMPDPGMPDPGMPDAGMPDAGPSGAGGRASAGLRPGTAARSAAPASGPGTPRTTLRTRQPGGASPFREDHATAGQRAGPTGPSTDEPSSAGTSADDVPGGVAARTGSSSVPVSEQVVASLVAGALADGLRPARADRDATAYDGTATTRDGAPHGEPADAGAAPLPRLRTGRSAEPGRRDRRPAAPEVTVNIGRIEVVPPPPDPRPAAPRPRPRTRASGAPALADYLRDRSRR